MAQDVEKGIDVADVYAAALFALAREQNVLDDVRDELAELVRLVERDRSFAAFIASAAVDDDEREQSLERMFRGRVRDVVLDTLQVMNRHGRLELIHALWRAYVLRLEDARGQIEVQATSAVELDGAQRAEIERLAAQLAGRKPLVQYIVDPDVIGGLVLRIGDHRYDHSLRRQLSAARRLLLERTNRAAATT